MSGISQVQRGFYFELQGVDALRRAFADLPAQLAADASRLAYDHAQKAAAQIVPVYASHEKTGNLRRGLAIDQPSVGRHARAARIRNRAPHAHLFEKGTAIRRTRRGWNRGAARPGGTLNRATFVPPVIHERALFEAEVADLLREAGLQVRR